MDPTKLLERFLGNDPQGTLRQTGSKTRETMDRMGDSVGLPAAQRPADC